MKTKPPLRNPGYAPVNAQTSQLSLFWCETQVFGPNLTLRLTPDPPNLTLFSVKSHTSHSFAIFTSLGLNLCTNWLYSYSIWTLFIVNLTDFTSKIWQLCSIASLMTSSYTNGIFCSFKSHDKLLHFY